MTSAVFLTIRDPGRQQFTLRAEPGSRAVRLPADAAFAYVLHGAQGETLEQPLQLRRLGDDLQIELRDADEPPLFVLTGFFQVHQHFEGLITDFSGRDYFSPVGPLSAYLPLLEPGEVVALELTPAAPWAAGAAGVGVGLSGSSSGAAAAAAAPLGAPGIASFADTDGDGRVNVSGEAEAGAVVWLVAPDGSRYSLSVNEQGQFAEQLALDQLGDYQLTQVSASGQGSAATLWTATDLSAPQWALDDGGALSIQDSSPLTTLRLRVDGVLDGGSEALWLGDLRLVWDGGQANGTVSVGDQAWQWTWWADGTLSLQSDEAFTADAVAALLDSMRWDAFGVPPDGSSRTAVFSAVDAAGNVSAPWPMPWASSMLGLAWDANGDGQITLGQVAKDVNGDGVLDQAATVPGPDAWLVFDRSQLQPAGGVEWGDFGVNFGAGSGGALGALAEVLDGNGDGVLDAQDPWISLLHVWRDANNNARVDADELQSWSEAGLAALSLMPTDSSPQVLTPWATALQRGELVLTDGSTQSWMELALVHQLAVLA
jgi:hypothetical protein